MTDTVRLRDKIKQSGLKKSFIAGRMELTLQGYLKKESGEIEFKAKEISLLKDLLKLSNKEVSEIFLS